MTRRNPMVYVYHMQDYARSARNMAQGYSREDVDSNEMLRLALMKAVEIIGEGSSQLPDDFRSLHPEIPWDKMRGLRNRLVHAYDRIDLDALWDIVQNDIPPLIQQLEDLIAKETDN